MGEFATRQRAFRAWVRRCLDWNHPLHSPVDFVRRHFREQRRRDAEWENEPDDGYGDDGAAEMMEAAGREIRARSRREAEIHGLILTALPPAPLPASTATSPALAEAAESPRNAAGGRGKM